MKVTLLKNTRKKEVMNRLELLSVVEMIRNNPEAQKVFNLRLNYSFMKPERKEDGQIVIDGDAQAVEESKLLVVNRAAAV